ncbi:MAG: hypothetical protein JXR77_16825, partial [Lentisphaeria bacterium]|nr:hypothetical protein [Lentisphaeria bacterium]
MEIATSRHGLRITRGVVAAWIGVCLSLCAAQRAYVPADWAFLRILNPRSPGDDRIRVLQGDPVVVAFDVNPQIVGPRPTDELQLRRVDDGSTVSRQPRGPGLSGTAYLDTGAANAIGELRVVYVETATQAVRGDAGETLSVLAGAGPPPSSITVPSATVPSIQMAIGMVADGGTIRIRPGTYRERLFIAGKRVHITSLRRSLRPNVILAADRPGSILPAAEALGVINFGTGGGGSIDNLLVSGGDAGIMGTGDGEQRPGAVTIQNTILSANGRGVLGTFSELTVRSSTVVG